MLLVMWVVVYKLLGFNRTLCRGCLLLSFLFPKIIIFSFLNYLSLIFTLSFFQRLHFFLFFLKQQYQGLISKQNIYVYFITIHFLLI